MTSFNDILYFIHTDKYHSIIIASGILKGNLRMTRYKGEVKVPRKCRYGSTSLTLIHSSINGRKASTIWGTRCSGISIVFSFLDSPSLTLFFPGHTGGTPV